jgi:hypothetical protein
MNATPASPAVALAKRVFPVPGGPVKRAPFIRTFIFILFLNSLKK